MPDGRLQADPQGRADRRVRRRGHGGGRRRPEPDPLLARLRVRPSSGSPRPRPTSRQASAERRTCLSRKCAESVTIRPQAWRRLTRGRPRAAPRVVARPQRDADRDGAGVEERPRVRGGRCRPSRSAARPRAARAARGRSRPDERSPGRASRAPHRPTTRASTSDGVSAPGTAGTPSARGSARRPRARTPATRTPRRPRRRRRRPARTRRTVPASTVEPVPAPEALDRRERVVRVERDLDDRRFPRATSAVDDGVRIVDPAQDRDEPLLADSLDRRHRPMLRLCGRSPAV